MAASPRHQTVLSGEVGVYHCIARCVRRSFLCGFDQLTGTDHEHRRDWILGFLQVLAGLMGVEVAFHAILSNHLHLVLRMRPDLIEGWSDEEVIRRYLTVRRYVRSSDGVSHRPVEDLEVKLELAHPDRVAYMRRWLSHVSGFMAALCEHVARRANAEDQVTGRFFEERFACRRLESEAALLACGIYVDLNEIRAGQAATPETSTHTSAFERIQQRQEAATAPADPWLCELTLDERSSADQPVVAQPGAPEPAPAAVEPVPVEVEPVPVGVEPAPDSVGWPARASNKGLLALTLDEYLELLDMTGRQMVAGKASIPAHLAPILTRLGIVSDRWLDTVTGFHSLFGRVVGPAEQVLARAAQFGRRTIRGVKHCALVFI